MCSSRLGRMALSIPVVLSIAGYDPSSGAGITADIKTMAAHGCFALTCATSLTVQSTLGVKRVYPLPPELIQQTLQELMADFQPAAVRIGMLGSAGVAATVADFLAASRLPNIVLDPILRSSSGADLLDRDGLQVMRERLLRLSTVITPNLAEAAALTGLQVADVAQMKLAARRLHEMGARQVVITGGHLARPMDLLSVQGEKEVRQEEFPGQRLESRSTHGTGCAFASALACNLAQEVTLPEATRHSGEYVRQAIAHAYPLGRGIGPLNHLYSYQR